MRLQHPPRTMTGQDLAEVQANFLARLNDGPLDRLPMGCQSDPEWQTGRQSLSVSHPRLFAMWGEFRRFKWARALASDVSTVACVRPMTSDDGSIGFEISGTPGGVVEVLAPRVVAPRVVVEAEAVLRDLPK